MTKKLVIMIIRIWNFKRERERMKEICIFMIKYLFSKIQNYFIFAFKRIIKFKQKKKLIDLFF
jgi:hypothetical protein